MFKFSNLQEVRKRKQQKARTIMHTLEKGKSFKSLISDPTSRTRETRAKQTQSKQIDSLKLQGIHSDLFELASDINSP